MVIFVGLHRRFAAATSLQSVLSRRDTLAFIRAYRPCDLVALPLTSFLEVPLQFVMMLNNFCVVCLFHLQHRL